MVRTYKPKTNIDEENVKSAVNEVLAKKLSIRKAAYKYNIKAATLQHRIEKFRKNFNENESSSSNTYSSKYTVAQVFSIEQEKVFTEYLLNCSKMHYGLSLKQLLTLAYEYAELLRCKYPESWKKNKSAGKDWAAGFRRRNQEVSLRKPENTSAARSFAFNKTAVTEFFDNYEQVMARNKFTPDRIIKDETGVNTVLPTPKVLAERKQRQVGQIVSAERGELVTFCGIVTATGVALPPVYVFPRVHFKQYFLNGAPEGSLGLANRSGWMTSELHIQVLKHIQRHTLCDHDNPILIICDNHKSHISIEAVNYCRDHGIVYLSLLPHTSHKMQPLDLCIFGPFKGKLKVTYNDWHTQNVGKTLSIYNVADLTKSAFLESFSPKNITSGFLKSEIWPFNRHIFVDEDFAPMEVFGATSQNHADENKEKNDKTPSDSTSVLSPELVRPYPKKITSENNSSRKGREKGKSRVLTDSPEKDRLQRLDEEKKRKQQVKTRKQPARKLKMAKK